MALSKILVDKFCKSVYVHGWIGFFPKILRSTAKEDCSKHLCVANSTGSRNSKVQRRWHSSQYSQSCSFLKGIPNLLQHLWKKDCWMALTICLSGNFLMVASRIQQPWSWLPLFLTQLFSTPFAGYQWYSFKDSVNVSKALWLS